MIGIKEENLLKEISIKPRTLEELSKLMNLSERSIRYKIKDLNDFLKDEKIEIEVILKKNIVEMIGDLNLLDKITFSKFNSYIFSQDERLEVLTNMLFFSEKKFQIEEYQDLVGISESTFKKDWKLLREKFDDLDIKIINRKYYTALEADEENIRNNLLKNIVKYKINSNNLILTNKIINMLIDNYFKEINFNDLENLLEEISRKLNITMSDDAYNIIKFNLAIALKRIEQSPLDIKNIKNIEFLKSTEEYKLVSRVLENFNSLFKKKSNLSEILNMTEYLLGSHSYNFKYSFYENWIHIESIIDKLIKSIGEDLEVNFQKDSELFEGVLNHIKPMIYRIRKGIKLENTITREIIEESPKIFLSLKKNIGILENFIKCKVDDDELSYLCVFFKLALKKHYPNSIPKAIIVCSFGYGISRVLEARLKDKFNISIIETLPQNKLTEEKIIEDEIDLIITTTSLENANLSVPVLKVSPLLGAEDIELLKKYGLKDLKVSEYYSSLMNIINKNCDIRNEEELKREISILLGLNMGNKLNMGEENKEFIDFINMKNIKVMEEISSFEEGIKIAGEMLIESGYITEDYIKSCIKAFNDQGAYMIIGGNTVLPHSDNFKSVIKTGYSFLKLKKPIIVEQDDENLLNIENIILLASSDGKNHRNSLLDLKNMIDKYKLEKSIHNCKTEKELLKKLNDVNSKKNGGQL